jgi:hypothetical protein
VLASVNEATVTFAAYAFDFRQEVVQLDVVACDNAGGHAVSDVVTDV